MTSYTFGVEIEAIAKPHQIRDGLSSRTHEYYRKVSAALKNRGLKAASDPLTPGRDARRPDSYNMWWITRDGSLKLSDSEKNSLVALEAVSPVLNTGKDWRREIDKFWDGYSAVFHMPNYSERCGSHYHISKGYSGFTLNELKTIAFGIVIFESQISEMLVLTRRTNEYCVPNTSRSHFLSQAYKTGLPALAQLIHSRQDATSLCYLMQCDRYILWNFENTMPGRTGTVEFRGGRCLRGKRRTRAWAAFTVSLIHWLLVSNHILYADRIKQYSAASMYRLIKTEAMQLGLGLELPASHRQLNETMYWV